MVKNHHSLLPLPSTTVVYVPERFYPVKKDWFGNLSTPKTEYPINLDLVTRFFKITNDPSQADVALIAIDSPQSGIGYAIDEANQGGNGFVPISLQYRPYTATHARESSLAGDDRSYRDKSVHTINECDLELVLATKQRMGDKPVIVAILTDRPFVIRELEPYVDAIFMHFGVQDQALLMMLAGLAEPSGLLPFRMPNDMETVELHHEDVADDIVVYVDQDGHAYDFAFGLSFQGPIDDERTTRYPNFLHTAFTKEV
jgi:beta-glucosidase